MKSDAGTWAASVTQPERGAHHDLVEMVVAQVVGPWRHMKGVSTATLDQYEQAAEWMLEVLLQA